MEKCEHVLKIVSPLPLVATMIWITGFVVSKGFWSTLACLFPPWAYYLVIEHFMIMLEWI